MRHFEYSARVIGAGSCHAGKGPAISTTIALACVFAAFLTPVRAELLLPSVFSDNMVLQRDTPVEIRGRAAPAASVDVEFAGQTHAAIADEDGRWQVCLDRLAASATPAVLTVTSTGSGGKPQKRQIRNILVGDVWFCSGQSNMEWAVNGALNAAEEIPAARYPELRIFKVRKDVTLEANEDALPEKPWSVCTPESVADFSAVAYYFGREIQRESGVPIGLIQASWGGTPIESWIPVPAMESDPECARTLEPWREMAAALPDYVSNFAGYVEERQKELQELNRVLWQWQLRKKEAKEQGTPFVEPPPEGPKTPLPGHQCTPGGLFNAMVAPLTRFPIRGVIWYQGESNANQVDTAQLYGKQLPMLIESWRTAWNQPGLPFYFAQVANFHHAQTEPKESGGWPLLREMQFQTWKSVPHTGMAVTIDLGEEDNIHPANKQEVGRRLALHALRNQYGKNITVAGPLIRAAQRKGDKVVLTFDHADGGLTARDADPRGFALADADGKWHWADAEISGGEIHLRSKVVPEATRVAYGWANNPVGNIIGKATGIPLNPFSMQVQNGGD